MRKRFGIMHFLFIFLGLQFACGPKENKSVEFPPNVLKEEELTRLLVSFALAESASNMNIAGVQQYEMDTVYAFRPLQENKVRLTQYDSTLAFYIRHPDLYKKVYENVLSTIVIMQTRRDSLNAVKK